MCRLWTERPRRADIGLLGIVSKLSPIAPQTAIAHIKGAKGYSVASHERGSKIKGNQQKQSFSQPVSQQSTNQLVSQSTNQSTNQSIIQSINRQTLNQPTNQSVNKPTNISKSIKFSQPTSQPVNKSMNRSIKSNRNKIKSNQNQHQRDIVQLGTAKVSLQLRQVATVAFF